MQGASSRLQQSLVRRWVTAHMDAKAQKTTSEVRAGSGMGRAVEQGAHGAAHCQCD